MSLDHDVGAEVVSQLGRWLEDGDAAVVPGLSHQARIPVPSAETTARSILANIGFLVSEQQVLSPQGASSGMFSWHLF